MNTCSLTCGWGATSWWRAVDDYFSPSSKLCAVIVSLCSIVPHLLLASLVSNGTCRSSLDISLNPGLCLSFSAHDDRPAEMGAVDTVMVWVACLSSLFYANANAKRRAPRPIHP